MDRTDSKQRVQEGREREDSLSVPLSVKSNRKKSHSGILFVLGLGAVVATGFVATNTEWYQERKFSRQTLTELQKQREAQGINNPIYLYHLGMQLNQQGKFVEADPVLRQAVGLDPHSVRYRDEWTKALLGSGLTTAAFGSLKEFVGTHPDSDGAHLLMGKFYATQNSMNKAAQEFEKAVSLNPKLEEAYAYLAVANEQLNRLDPAIEAARKAVALDKADPKNWLMLATLLSRTQGGEEVRNAFEQTLKLASTTASSYREYALWLSTKVNKLDDLSKAEQYARKALALDPQDIQSTLILGKTLDALGRGKEATEYLKTATLKLPSDTTPVLALIRNLRSLGFEQEAKVWQANYEKRQRQATQSLDLTAQIERNPGDAAPHLKLAKLSAEAGNVAGCIRHYSEAKRVPLDSPTALIPAANDLTLAGFAREALPLAQRAVAVTTSSPEAHEALGNALLGCGQPREAAASYDLAAKWSPDKLPIYQKKLAVYLQANATKSLTPAEKAYRQSLSLMQREVGPIKVTPEVLSLAEKAVSLEPKHRDYVLHLLNSQFESGQKEKATQTARFLLTQFPEEGIAHAILAIVALQTQVSSASLMEAETHLTVSEKDPKALEKTSIGKGLLFLQRKQFSKAIDEFEKALKTNPENLQIYGLLAKANRNAGNLEAAKRYANLQSQRQKQNAQEIVALGDISAKPDVPDSYEKAAKIFEAHGRLKQAAAIRASAKNLLAENGRGQIR